jgi:hypothetical protein
MAENEQEKKTPAAEETPKQEGEEATEGEKKKKKKSLLKALPLGLSPVLLLVALLAIGSVVMSAMAYMKMGGYQERYNAALLAARDPGNLAHFKKANLKLRDAETYRPGTLTIVYGADFGHHWEMLKLLWDDGVINRSIPRQDITQMILRFEQDVLSLEPKTVILMPPLCSAVRPRQLLVWTRVLAGTAEAMGIQPVLAQLPPIPAALDKFEGGYRGKITALNRELVRMGKETGWPVLDLYSPLAGDDYYMNDEYCGETLCPNGVGYRELTGSLEAILDSLSIASTARPSVRLAEAPADP